MTAHEETNTKSGKGKSATEIPSPRDTVLEHGSIGLQRALFFRQIRLMNAARATTLTGSQE